MTLPPLADFAVRLAGGLAGMLLVTPWRIVPPPFFRTHCQVILGLLVLAALALTGLEGDRWWFVLVVSASASAFLASIAWGLGLPRVGLPLTVLIVLATASVLISASADPKPELWLLNGAGRLTSSALMGSALTAMLLGHHYLTAPAMSIEPLKRFVRLTALSLGVRIVLAALGLGLWFSGWGAASATADVPTLFLLMRWAMGVLVPAIAVVMTWKTVAMRSTQSATGILYIAVTLLLVGEIAALILSSRAGVVF